MKSCLQIRFNRRIRKRLPDERLWMPGCFPADQTEWQCDGSRAWRKRTWQLRRLPEDAEVLQKRRTEVKEDEPEQSRKAETLVDF